MTGAGTAKVGAVSLDVRAIRARDRSAGPVVLGPGELESVVERVRRGVRAPDGSFGDRSGTTPIVSARARPRLRPTTRL